MTLLDSIRSPIKRISLEKAVLVTFLVLCAGAVAGVGSKLLDIYTTNLGNVFSQMSVWIFLCTLLSVYSTNAKRAAANVFSFCAGMLPAYYITAELTESVYSPPFIIGWTVFALFSPLMGFCAWYARGKGRIPKLISAGIILVLLAVAVVLFDRIRIADIIFALLLGAVLFRK